MPRLSREKIKRETHLSSQGLFAEHEVEQRVGTCAKEGNIKAMIELTLLTRLT